MSHGVYALNSLIWFLSGFVVASVGWYVSGRRAARRAGAPALPSLQVFTSIALGMVGLIAVLIGIAGQIENSRTNDCVNNILGTRGPLTQRDTTADLAFLRALYSLTLDKPNSPEATRDAKVLIAQIADTYHIKLADQAERAAHPLGEC